MSYDELRNRVIIFGGQTLKGEFCIPRVHAFQLPDWMNTNFRAKPKQNTEKLSPYQSLIQQEKKITKKGLKKNLLYTVP